MDFRSGDRLDVIGGKYQGCTGTFLGYRGQESLRILLVDGQQKTIRLKFAVAAAVPIVQVQRPVGAREGSESRARPPPVRSQAIPPGHHAVRIQAIPPGHHHAAETIYLVAQRIDRLSSEIVELRALVAQLERMDLSQRQPPS